jgi:predicted MFS family arabinose efflux permease
MAMYAPSLFSGRLLAWIGQRAGMLTGLVLMGASLVIDRAGHGLPNYWWGLVLLGVGWNLLFVGATTLLTTTYRPDERFRAQGLNEFAVFGTQALASLLAGPAIHGLGWSRLNLVAAAPVVALAIALVGWRRVGR